MSADIRRLSAHLPSHSWAERAPRPRITDRQGPGRESGALSKGTRSAKVGLGSLVPDSPPRRRGSLIASLGGCYSSYLASAYLAALRSEASSHVAGPAPKFNACVNFGGQKPLRHYPRGPTRRSWQGDRYRVVLFGAVCFVQHSAPLVFANPPWHPRFFGPHTARDTRHARLTYRAALLSSHLCSNARGPLQASLVSPMLGEPRLCQSEGGGGFAPGTLQQSVRRGDQRSLEARPRPMSLWGSTYPGNPPRSSTRPLPANQGQPRPIKSPNMHPGSLCRIP